MAEAGEKRKVTVTVAGRAYTLVTTDEPSYVKRVAEVADRTLRETSAALRQSPQAAAPLAVISLSDELLKARDELTHVQRELTRVRQLLAENRAGNTGGDTR